MKIQFEQVKGLSIQELFGPKEQEVSKLSFHSKRVETGTIFFSMKGENADGHLFIEDAIQLGATVIVGNHTHQLSQLSERYSACTFIAVPDVRKAMAYLAKHFYRNADEKIKTIGVTGTNGKTTVTAYVRSLLTLLGLRTGSIGTTGIWSSTDKIPYKKSTPTTPESIDLHQIFHDLDVRKDQAAVMEATSIGIDQKRLEGIDFDVAILTNFSEEHLEYHHTIARYKGCKQKLFDQAKTAVINLDDEEMGRELAETFQGPSITYSIQQNPEADILADNIQITENGASFDLHILGKTYFAHVPVYGTYNVANVLSAIAAALHLNYSIEEIVNVLPQLESPVGRFQVIQTPMNQKVILDYAHTPVAITRLVEEVKKLDYNRLIVMIAGIGIRDFNKMPKMAAAIEGQADEVIVTVDHPGYHDPQAIVDQVMKGFTQPQTGHIYTSLTREEGVLRSLSIAEPNDIILLTSGCINEAQMVKGEEIPHSDEEIIRNYYHSSPHFN